MKNLSKWIVLLALVASFGCAGSGNAGKPFVGTYALVLTPDLVGTLSEQDRKDAEKITLRLNADGTFAMAMLDPTNRKPTEAKGNYVVESDGKKLTLTPTEIAGGQPNGADAKPLSLTFDEKEKTVTGDTGGGPKLVMKLR